MDSTHLRMFWGGLGVALLLFCLEVFVTPPQWMFYPLIGLAVALMVYGVWPYLQRIQLRSPFHFVDTSKASNSHAVLMTAFVSLIILLATIWFRYPFEQSKNEEYVWFNETTRQLDGAVFRNETVLLDGLFCRECTFINVTLVYEGKAIYHLINCHFEGDTRIQTHDYGLNAFYYLLDFFKLSDKKVELIPQDKGNPSIRP